MTAIILKGAPITFILLFLAIYVLGVFLYFIFTFGKKISLPPKELIEKWEKEKDIEELLIFNIPKIRSFYRHIQFLRLVVNLAPLLGLLGTVLGIVKSTGGLVLHDQNTLLLGISQSLITTAMGLMVSVPALIVHFFVKTSLEKKVFDLKQKAYNDILA